LEANFGYFPCLPIDFLIDPTNAPHKGILKSHDVVQQIDTCLQIVRERLEDVQDQMAMAANEHRRAHSFRTGDKVLINTSKLPMSYANVQSSSRKLQHRFAGPFVLGKQYGEKAFEIVDFFSPWRLHNVFNVDRFKLDTADPSRPTPPPPPLRSTIHHGDEWEVAAILNQNRTTMRDLEYHLKWVGYEPTWERVMDLKGTVTNS
jgi:hypothetical protein